MRLLAAAPCAAALAVATVVLACAAPSVPPAAPRRAPESPPPSTAAPEDATASSDAAAQDQRLAAIQHAMNELDEGAQLCWAAAAAVDGYQLAGEMALTIDIASPTSTVTVARDNTKDPRLLACMRELLAGYGWAPPLRGETIQLPFAFRAPSGQSVIDRRLVPVLGQGPAPQVSVSVLLDEQNTGSAAASMFEVHLTAGGSTQLRLATRSEAWFFLAPATVTDGRGAARSVAAGDMLLVPKDGVRKISATEGATRAVVVMTPGGEEGSARVGALPTPAPPASQAATTAPALVLVRAAAAPRYPRPAGAVQLYLDPSRTKRGELSASLLSLDAGAAVPSHQHATETELLYVLEGAGTLTVGGVSLAVTPTSVLQLPPGVPHAFVATTAVRAIQIYTPAGPEQRFKTPSPPPP